MSKSSQFVGSNQTEVIGHSRRTRLLPRPRMGRFYVESAGGRRFDVIVAMDLHATNTSKRSRMENSRTNFSICQAVTTSRTLRTLDIWRPMTVSDSAGDNFDGHAIEEYTVTDRKSTRLNSSHRCISYAV